MVLTSVISFGQQIIPLENGDQLEVVYSDGVFPLDNTTKVYKIELNLLHMKDNTREKIYSFGFMEKYTVSDIEMSGDMLGYIITDGYAFKYYLLKNEGTLWKLIAQEVLITPKGYLPEGEFYISSLKLRDAATIDRTMSNLSIEKRDYIKYDREGKRSLIQE